MGNIGWTTGRPWSVQGLRHEEVSESRLRPGSVRVELVGMALNPVDYRLSKSLPLPLWGRKLLGSDFSGRVISVGSGVTHVQEGDSVYGMLSALRGGVSSDRIVVPAGCLSVAPKQVDLVEAAAIPLAALTSLQSLRDHGSVKSGDQILVNGASGGVGTFAVQLAKQMGVDVVGTCSPANHDFVQSLGASHVLDYRQVDFTQEDASYDGVFDARGNRSLSDCARVVRDGGWVVTSEPTLPHLVKPLTNRFRRVSVHAVLVRAVPADLQLLAEWVDAGALKPVVEKIYGREEFKQAYERLRSRRTRGKLVIRW